MIASTLVALVTLKPTLVFLFSCSLFGKNGSFMVRSLEHFHLPPQRMWIHVWSPIPAVNFVRMSPPSRLLLDGHQLCSSPRRWEELEEMSCFACFLKNDRRERSINGKKEQSTALPHKDEVVKVPEQPPLKNIPEANSKKDTSNGNIAAQTFTFQDLASATKNFQSECLIGEGGFGRVYKGCLENTGEIVAIKQLDRNGFQGSKEFLVEVLMLSFLHHPNLVKLIGYCADGDQRLLVYEFMTRGSLEDHLLDLSPDQKHLGWHTRMKIATGAAKGVEYLHDKANPPVIYRDLKSSNILLDDEFNPKLSDFGLAKLGPFGEDVHVSSQVMGTYGYCSPEYVRTGQLTLKSDVYSFGVVLLELITGRRAVDTTKPTSEQNLVAWAQPLMKDKRRFHEMVDPLLQGDYPATALNQAIAVAAMCLLEEAAVRPLMADVVQALKFLSLDPSEDNPVSSPSPSY